MSPFDDVLSVLRADYIYAFADSACGGYSHQIYGLFSLDKFVGWDRFCSYFESSYLMTTLEPLPILLYQIRQLYVTL